MHYMHSEEVQVLAVGYSDNSREDFYPKTKNKPCTPHLHTHPAMPYKMTIDELLLLHEETCENCREVMKAKNHDYCDGGVNGVFSNFQASAVLGVDPIIGILLRVMDKIARVVTFVNKGGLKVAGEGVYDATDDIINYIVLVKGMLTEQERNKSV